MARRSLLRAERPPVSPGYEAALRHDVVSLQAGCTEWVLASQTS
jgi:hypothetical protein